MTSFMDLCTPEEYSSGVQVHCYIVATKIDNQSIREVYFRITWKIEELKIRLQL